ncbi:MAG: glycosyltransferase family 4 protein [Chthoniobacter sp.]|nr:glycosyltransferase family 4 protein [Chthoniobacter sp.]
MKIVLLTPGTGSYYCGVCMRDNALAKELIRQGHDAVMLPMYLPLTLDEDAASPDSEIFFGGVNVYLQQKFALFRRTPRWLDRLLNARGLLRLAGKQSGMTATADVGALTLSMLHGEHGHQAKELAKLVEWLRGHRPDAVWLSTALLVGLARGIKDAIGIPVLASLQGEDSFLDALPEPWRTRAWQAMGERAWDCDACIAPSRYYAELMGRRMRLPADKLRVIPNGVAAEEKASGERQTANAPETIGYLARFIPGKGLGLVVEAFILLKKRGRFPHAKLRCAGAMTADDERYVATLRRKLADAGLAGDAEFLPNVSREEKTAFLHGLTLLSVPASYGEAFGLYLIEAWSAGVPVVQPRCAAFPELVEATGGGILCEPNSAEALANGWETLLTDPAQACAMGARGRAVVASEFSLPRMAERFVALTAEFSKTKCGIPFPLPPANLPR